MTDAAQIMGAESPTTIRRTLYTQPSISIYAVPPLRPGAKGYSSIQWTTQPPIFTARLEIIETTTTSALTSVTPSTASITSSSSSSSIDSNADDDNELGTTTTITILLLDPSTGELFAAAPYTHTSTVTPCIDSGRFFAVRVADDAGRKATLGVGFEEREGAFEFLEGLGRAGRMLGFGSEKEGTGRPRESGSTGRVVKDMRARSNEKVEEDHKALFAIAPPPPPADATSGSSNASAGYKAANGRSNVATNDEPPDFEADDDFGDFQ